VRSVALCVEIELQYANRIKLQRIHVVLMDISEE
jgi:hypothetical protein